MSDYSGTPTRFDLPAALALWEALGWPVRSGRLAPDLARVQVITDAALAESNTLLAARREREARAQQRYRRGR
ncbi:hypothetical protein [Pararhodospirillum photometricum]|uniref:hypothetical protein n=1 Tax=Pararhodospirillum photometricum TaxID=1084 RepID=UPI0012FF0590|nr:hypothetical protein [Pararhodospirillum photometricum]